MGSFKKGILGGFSGGIGTVIGGRWKSIDYMRSRPVGNTSSTPAQQVQRAKFTLVAQFIRSFNGLLKTTFKDGDHKMSGHNSALSYTLKNAVTGEYPDLSIDFSLVLVAKGNLPGAPSPAAATVPGGKISFSWMDNSGVGQAKPKDKAILVAYLAERNECIFTMKGGDRSMATAVLDTPYFSGKEVHTWLAFITEKGQEVSPSVYTGKIT